MSLDETLLLVFSTIAAFALWKGWFVALVADRSVGANFPRIALGWTPPLAAGVVLAVLLTLAADDVRGSLVYVLMYLVLGGAWAGFVVTTFPALGLEPLVDLAERRNAAAEPLVLGGVLGASLCYAGGNIGNGPGWWVVLFCAALATAGLLALWGLLNAVSHATDRVVIDRDPAAGLRLGALLLCAGAILGRAVAGDWISAPATLDDFAKAVWPAAALAAAEALVALATRPSPERVHAPYVAAGVMPSLAYAGATVAWLVRLGWPA